MNGVTGRMGYNQHLVRSVLAINADGGVPLSDGSRVRLAPVLVGRSEAKLREIATRHGLSGWTTSLAEALDAVSGGRGIYFDAQVTSARRDAVLAAIGAGAHVYVEKPSGGTLAEAREVAAAADSAGVKGGVVQDKLFLPGIRKLRALLDSGFLGRILSVRGEFGYWVFEGDQRSPQRPSWNYRAADGGGIVLDMFPHWTYVLEAIAGPITAVTARAVTHIPARWDERGQRYDATADDAAYAIFELAGGAIAQVNSSWCVRVHRGELVEFQVDGTDGSAVAGLRECVAQHRALSPRPTWNPDIPNDSDYLAQWQPVPLDGDYGNAFRLEWEMFVRHVAEGAPFSHDLHSGARGLQVAEAGLLSSAEGRRVEVQGGNRPPVPPGLSGAREGGTPKAATGARGCPPESTAGGTGGYSVRPPGEHSAEVRSS
jgi:predicted dehydrogenase